MTVKIRNKNNYIVLQVIQKHTYRYIVLLFIFFLCQVANAIERSENLNTTWAGIEVFGVNKVEAQKIKTLIPIQIGTPFILSQKEKYRSMCNVIRERTTIEDVNCSFILFGTGEAYFDIEITPAGAKKHKFRSIPQKKESIATLPRELSHLYDQWDKRMFLLISNGKNIGENYKNGFLDFDDPILHKLAVDISKCAYNHNDKLLDIILYSPNDDERHKAAMLLAWAKHPDENLAFILKWDLLNDPNKGVRNYLARSFSLLLGEVKDESLLKKLIPVYCHQATLPSHTDRNKALFSLLSILEAQPELRTAIHSECRNTISYIRELSILENVGGVAEEILAILEKESVHG